MKKMHHCAFLVLGLVSLGFGTAPLFETKTPSIARLDEKESRHYARVKTIPRAKNVKLVAIDEAVLSSKTAVQLEFSKGVRGVYEVSKDEGGSWSGKSGKNFDRFTIREIDGTYSGHFLHKGKQYALVPIKHGVSALYEVDSKFECGIKNVTEAAR